MSASYIDKNLIQEIFNSNEFKGWILSKRWFSDKTQLSNLDFKIKIEYFQLLEEVILLINIEITKPGYSKFYFLPLISYEKKVQEVLEPEEQSTENIIKLTSNTFSKKVAMTMENKQEIITLNLVEAEFCLFFWRKILFDKNLSEQFPSYNLNLELFLEQFEDPVNMKKVQELIEASLHPNRYTLSLSQLGKGNTTNLVFRLDVINTKKQEKNPTSFVLKSYKEYTENIETSTLFILVKNSFPNAPKIYGTFKIQNKDSIGILEMVENDGNIGEIYWNELNSMINDIFKDIHGNYSKFEDKTTISNNIKQYCGETLRVSKEIGTYISRLHQALKLPENKDQQDTIMSSKEFFEEYSKKLSSQITNLQKTMKKESKRSYYNLPKIISILIDTQDLVEKFITEYTSEEVHVQKIHQDLHMEQVLYKKENGDYIFFFTDFEGDPQLDIQGKKGKFPVEKDLASFLRALSYIKFNTLLLYIEKKLIKKGEYEVPEEILYRMFFRRSARPSNQIVEIVLRVLNAWEDKMMGKILKNLNVNITLISFFSIERVLHEINYEILYRPNKSIVPILGLKEILDKN